MVDIFREVDEELRRDNAQQLWDKYGVYLIGAAVGIVAVTSAVVGWRAYTASVAEDASRAFIAAEAAAEKEDADAAAIFAEFAEDAPAGYAALAQLREAAALSEAGDIDGAIQAYGHVAGDSGTSGILRDLARVKAGTLLVGRTSYDDLAVRLLPLTGEGEAWRNPAREVLGIAAYREQKYNRAKAYFMEIVGDPTATPGVRDRAHVMIALIDPQVSPEQAAEDTAPAEAAAETDTTGAVEDVSEEAQ